MKKGVGTDQISTVGLRRLKRRLVDLDCGVILRRVPSRRIWGMESSARPDPSARPSRQDDSRTLSLQPKSGAFSPLSRG
jgi:hypothetical protein